MKLEYNVNTLARFNLNFTFLDLITISLELLCLMRIFLTYEPCQIKVNMGIDS